MPCISILMMEWKKRVSRLTDTDIKRAAQQHLQGIEDSLEHDLMDACMPHDEMDDIEEYITDAFAVGAKWGAQRVIKDLWHSASEEPPRYDDYLVKTMQGCTDVALYDMEGWHQPYIGGGDVVLWLDLADIQQ